MFDLAKAMEALGPLVFMPDAATEADRYAADNAIAGDRSIARRRSVPRGRLAGVVVSSFKEQDREVVTEEIQCCHCGRNWPYMAGSGEIRGWCGRCAAFTCGPFCPAGTGCVPKEQFLQNLARGLPGWTERAPSVQVPATISGILLGSK
jgi:hypothetical protein